MPTKILVVGGAGYIGSHMTLLLEEAGYKTIVFDNLQTGFREAVFTDCFVEGSLLDKKRLEEVFSQHKISAVLHFAALTRVDESVVKPHLYYRNNVLGTLNLLDVMIEQGVNRLIFSSTAAVYGNPVETLIDEEHPKQPVNPYGQSKWMIENMLEDYARAYGLSSIGFRYFNAAGCDPDGRTGERRDPPSHLIPVVLQAAAGLRPHFTIFGRDYPTRDGTCVRDYVHVTDLCGAHLRGLEKILQEEEVCTVYNLGSGRGFSVKEVYDIASRVTEKEIPLIYGPRREGDPPELVANSMKARQELNWKPQHSDLPTIINHNWQWYTAALVS
ncbi:MAG: UDP-glucose 4-epimerase GalE [Chlamydiales bacterium]